MGRGVRIPISLEKDKAEADAKEFSKELKEGMKDAAEFGVVAKEAFDALKESLMRLVEITKEVVQASAEQEQQETRTFAALQLHTQFAEENMQMLAAQNEARRQGTAISNAQQLQLEGTALQMGVEAGQLKTVIDATVNLSNVTGRDLGASLVSVVKLYEGNTKALQRMGIEVESVSEGFDKLTSLNSVTAAHMETFSGRVDMLKSNFEELMVALGDAIVRNEDVKQFLDELSEYLKKLIDEVLDNGPAFKARVSEIVSELRELGTWIRDHKDDIAEMIHLFSLASEVKIGASVVQAGANLAKGPAGAAAGGALATGAKYLAGGTVDAIAGGGALGLGAIAGLTGLGALGGLIGLQAYDQHEESRFHNAATLRGDIEDNDPDNNPLGKHKSPGFQRSMTMGGGLANVVDEFGTVFTKSEIDKDIKQREEYAKKKKAIEDKAYAEYMKIVDMDLAAYHERNQSTERLEEEEVRAKAQWRKKDEEQEKTDRALEAENREYRNAAMLNGFKTGEDLRQAEIAQQVKFARTKREIDDQQSQQTFKFWKNQVDTVGQGLGQFSATMTKGFMDGAPNAAAAAKGFFGSLLSELGQYLITLGIAVESAAILSTPAPWAWAATGGPAAIAAGIGLIALGGGLVGAGSALSSGGGGGGGSPSIASAPSSGSNRLPSAGIYSGGGGSFQGAGGNGIAVINVNIGGSGFMVGNSAEVARYLADLLSGNSGMSFG